MKGSVDKSPNLSSSSGPTHQASSTPGEGIRSLETTGVFRAVNFELYAKPNKWMMGFGIIAFTGCIGYLTWMKNQERSQGLYTAMNDKDELYVAKRRNKWD